MKRIISLTLISALIFSLCSCSTAGAEETSTETVSAEAAMTETSEVESTEASESSAETEQYDDIESYFIVETTSYTNPFSPSSLSTNEYDSICHNIMSAGLDWMLRYGFDNDATLNELRNEIYDYTGENNSEATLSDVAYFQGTERMAQIVATDDFAEAFSGELFSPYMLAYVRAIMQINGWRFGIDEIPYDYIYQRFPGFMDSVYETGDIPILPMDPRDPNFTTMTDPIAFNNMYDYDYVMFLAITGYNDVRVTYIYNNPYGNIDNLTDDILQVRDAETGRNVLVPTEEQYYQMMDDITSIPGCENVDIRFVETRENFYESYGCYPEDLVNDTMIYEGNVSN